MPPADKHDGNDGPQRPNSAPGAGDELNLVSLAGRKNKQGSDATSPTNAPDTSGQPKAQSIVADRLHDFTETIAPLATEWDKDSASALRYERWGIKQAELQGDGEFLALDLEKHFPGKGAQTLEASIFDPHLQEEILSNLPELSKSYVKYIKDYMYCNGIGPMSFDKTVEERRVELENKLNQFATANSLPKVHIIAEHEVDSPGMVRAFRSPGTGDIVVSRSALLGIATPAQVVGLIGRAYTVSEQEYTVVCHLADQVQVGQTSTPEQTEQIKKTFEKLMSAPLTDERLSEILASRQGKALPPEQAARAAELEQSMDRISTYAKQTASVRRDINSLDEEEQKFMSSPRDYLFKLDAGAFPEAEATLKTLFGSSPVPPEVTKLIAASEIDGALDAQPASRLMRQVFRKRRNELAEQVQQLRQDSEGLSHVQESAKVQTDAEALLPPSARQSSAQRTKSRGAQALLDTLFGEDDEPESDQPSKAPERAGTGPTSGPLRPEETDTPLVGHAGAERTDLVPAEEKEQSIARLNHDELAAIEEAHAKLEAKTDRDEAEEVRFKTLDEFLKHQDDPAVHERMIELMGENRPEGGYKGASARNAITSLCIILTALLRYSSERSTASGALQKPIPATVR